MFRFLRKRTYTRTQFKPLRMFRFLRKRTYTRTQFKPLRMFRFLRKRTYTCTQFKPLRMFRFLRKRTYTCTQFKPLRMVRFQRRPTTALKLTNGLKSECRVEKQSTGHICWSTYNALGFLYFFILREFCHVSTFQER